MVTESVEGLGVVYGASLNCCTRTHGYSFLQTLISTLDQTSGLFIDFSYEVCLVEITCISSQQLAEKVLVWVN